MTFCNFSVTPTKYQKINDKFECVCLSIISRETFSRRRGVWVIVLINDKSRMHCLNTHERNNTQMTNSLPNLLHIGTMAQPPILLLKHSLLISTPSWASQVVCLHVFKSNLCKHERHWHTTHLECKIGALSANPVPPSNQYNQLTFVIKQPM
jgi:hypothetical protein